MPLSTHGEKDATPGSPTSSNDCQECGLPNTSKATIVLGFGDFHPECVDTCPHGWVWPRSLVCSDEVAQYCGGCAIDAAIWEARRAQGA